MWGVYIFIGIIIGCALTAVFDRLFSGYDGSITLDDTDEQRTVWILRYDRNPNKLYKQKSIRLKVKLKK